MDYLTIKEFSELSGRSERHIRRLCCNGSIESTEQINNSNGRKSYIIPISALSEDLQAKYYRRKQTEAGILPEKIESAAEKKTYLKYGSKGVKMPFERFSQAEREEIQKWISLLEEWQGERSGRKNKTEFDKVFVAHQKYISPDLNISESILYRKYLAYKNECYAELIDNRGGWNRGTSKLSIDNPIWQCFAHLYFGESKPVISQCYRSTVAAVTITNCITLNLHFHFHPKESSHTSYNYP